MLLPDLREQVLNANLELVRQGLVLFTFGNVSGIAREKGSWSLNRAESPTIP